MTDRNEFERPLPARVVWGTVIGEGIAIVVIIWLFFQFVVPALSHEAPTGWTYPYACCSNNDCREVNGRHHVKVTEGWNGDRSLYGYTIGTTGEFLPLKDRRVRPSPDGLWHWCSGAGSDNGRTICLFVPLGGA